MLEKMSAGDNIASLCTKCNMVLDHIVVAMDGEVIAKVKCRTCGSAHRYRKPGSGVAAVKKTRTPRAKKPSPPSAEAIWAACLAEARGKERTYDTGGRYRVGDIVDHHVFGKGVVRKIYVNKCDVLFRDKERLMASGNS
jgi:hypothetical protein